MRTTGFIHPPAVRLWIGVLPSLIILLLVGVVAFPLVIHASEYNYWTGPGYSLPPSLWELEVRDFNRDGHDDLFFLRREGPDFFAYLAYDNGEDGFDGAGSRWFSSVDGSAPDFNPDQYEVFVGDFNADGDLDLVARDRGADPAEFRVGLNISDTLFIDWGTYGPGSSTAPDLHYMGWELFVEDFDGDGDCDLIGRNRDPGGGPLYRIGLNNGLDFWGEDGPWDYIHNYNNMPLPYDEWEMYLLDINEDDTLDIVGRSLAGEPLFKVGVHTVSYPGVHWFAWLRDYYSDATPPDVYRLDAEHFDLEVGDATGDGRSDLIGRQVTWARSKHYVAERLGGAGNPEFIESEGDTLDWWNVPAEFTNDGSWEYVYGDFTGDGRMDVLARGTDGRTYYVAESSSDTSKGTHDFLGAERWRYVAVEGDEELLNANYLDSIYIVNNMIYLKGIECQVGQIRSDVNKTIYFRTREGVNICNVEFSFPVGDLIASPNPIREYPNNITLENDNLVMSAKADGSFWFFLKTTDDVVEVHDPVMYDYRKYLQRTSSQQSDTISYVHLNDEMGYTFINYDVFGSFEGDEEDYCTIKSVDSQNPAFYSTGNAAFIVNVFPAGKLIEKKLLRNRFMNVHPTQYRDSTYITCDSVSLQLPSLETVQFWVDSLITNDAVGRVYQVGANSLLLFEDIWIRQPYPRYGSPAPYIECEEVYNPAVGNSLAEHIEAYKSLSGVHNILIYVSAHPAFNDLLSRPDSSTAELFLAEIRRLWQKYHEDLPEGSGIDGFYLDLFPATFYMEDPPGSGNYELIYSEKDAAIRLSYEVVRGVREIIGDDNIFYVHSTINPVHGNHPSPAPYGDGEYYKDISANRDVYAPFLDVYADYILRGEHGPIFDSDFNFIDDGSEFINDHLRYVCRTKNRSNSIGVAKLSPHPDFPIGWGNDHEWIDPFNPIQKDRRSPVRPFSSNVDSIADLQARYFQTYLADEAMVLWKGARKSLTEYRDGHDDFYPRYTDDYNVYETQLFNYWRWLVGPKRREPQSF